MGREKDGGWKVELGRRERKKMRRWVKSRTEGWGDWARGRLVIEGIDTL